MLDTKSKFSKVSSSGTKALTAYRISRLHILFIHEYIPRPDRGGSDVRMLQVLDVLLAMGHSVSLLSVRTSAEPSYVTELTNRGVTVYEGDRDRLLIYGVSEPAASSLHDAFSDCHYDLIVLSLWFWSFFSVPELYLEEIRGLAPDTRICILTDDRHAQRKAMAASVLGGCMDRECANDIKIREAQILTAADVVFTITTQEACYSQQLAPNTPVTVIPFAVPYREQRSSIRGRSGVVILANFQNDAVQDGVTWFLASVWPHLVSANPFLTLTLAGNASDLYTYGSAPRVEAIGYVKDVAGFLRQYRMFVSPIRIGTGVSTKALLSLSCGIPLVTTSCGAQGLGLSNGVNAVIADTREDFVSSVLRCYDDETLLQQLADAGQTHVSKTFSWAQLQLSLTTAIDLILRIPVKQGGAMHNPFILLQRNPHKVLGDYPPEALPLKLLFQYLVHASVSLEKGAPKLAADFARKALGWGGYLRCSGDSEGAALLALADSYHAMGQEEEAIACMDAMRETWRLFNH